MAKHKRRRRKNPYYWNYTRKTPDGKTERQRGRTFVTDAEVVKLSRKRAALKKKIRKTKSKAAKRLFGGQIRKIDSVLKMKSTSRSEALKERREALAAGYTSGKLKRAAAMPRKKRRKSKSKSKKHRRGSARKAASRSRKHSRRRSSKKAARARAARKAAATRRRKKLARSKAAKKAARKRKARAARGWRKKHRRHAHMRHHIPIPKKKGRAVSFRIGKRRYAITRKNPIGGNMFDKWLGHSGVEVGGLAAGGAIYGAVNGLASRIPGVRNVQAQLVKVPVVGNSLVPLLAGVLLNQLGKRQKINALEIVGKGLVGASVVGMGVNASALIPFLRPKTLGAVDYTMQGLGELPEGISGADFGDGEFGEDFGALEDGQLTGVDYTMQGDEPAMGDELGEDISGVDYTMQGDEPAMGAADFGAADFGEDFGAADFGEVPEGVSGFGQMG